MKSKNSEKSQKPARKTAASPSKASVSASASSKTQKTARKPAAAAKEKQPTRSAKLKIPPILLEGDAPSAPTPSGPGQRYSLGPTPPAPPAQPKSPELPEAYGTQQLFLTARDPHWLFAYWDLTNEQLKKYNGLSVDQHLVLRVHRDAIAGEPL